MRIGFIIYGSLNTLTGGYLYDRVVIQGLRELGHDVEVISLPSGSYLRRLTVCLSPRRYRRLLTGKFDIIIEDELCHPSLFMVNKRLRQQPGPLLVALIHHTLSDEPRRRWKNALLALVERQYLDSVDGYIHNSETTSRKVASLLTHCRPQLVAYPAGDRFGSPLAPEIISRRAHRPGPLELLFLGIVVPRKGLLPLLGALAGVDRKIWRLSIVGSLDFNPAYTIKARQLVQQLGLSAYVRFLGPLQDNPLIEILRNSHLLCMPYAYEGFGIAILEAMAFGLPAIGCSNGAASETIRHGKNGYLLAPEDLDGLRPLLGKLHRDRTALQRRALAACTTYADSPSWQDSIAAIEKFLYKLKDLKTRPPESLTSEDYHATG